VRNILIIFFHYKEPFMRWKESFKGVEGIYMYNNYYTEKNIDGLT